MSIRSREKRVVGAGKGVSRGSRIEGISPANGDYSTGARLVAAQRKEKQDMARIAKQRRSEIMEANSSPEKKAAQKARNEDVKNRLRREFIAAKIAKERPDYESMDEMMQGYIPVDRELAKARLAVRVHDLYKKKNGK